MAPTLFVYDAAGTRGETRRSYRHRGIRIFTRAKSRGSREGIATSSRPRRFFLSLSLSLSASLLRIQMAQDSKRTRQTSRSVASPRAGSPAARSTNATRGVSKSSRGDSIAFPDDPRLEKNDRSNLSFDALVTPPAVPPFNLRRENAARGPEHVASRTFRHHVGILMHTRLQIHTYAHVPNYTFPQRDTTTRARARSFGA